MNPSLPFLTLQLQPRAGEGNPRPGRLRSSPSPPGPPNASRRCPGSPPLRPRRAHHVSPGSEGRGHAPWRAAARWRGLSLPPREGRGHKPRPPAARELRPRPLGNTHPPPRPPQGRAPKRGVARQHAPSGRGQRSRAGLPPHPPPYPPVRQSRRGLPASPRRWLVRCGEKGGGRGREVPRRRHSRSISFPVDSGGPGNGGGGGKGNRRRLRASHRDLSPGNGSGVGLLRDAASSREKDGKVGGGELRGRDSSKFSREGWSIKLR